MAAKKKKSEAAEVAKRVEEVLRIRIDGAQFHDVAEYAEEKKWGVAERQIRKYMARADALLHARRDKSRKQVIARHLSQRQALYARCVNAADYRTALAVLADDAKLRGLYPEREIKELVKLATAQNVRIAELEKRLRDAHVDATTPPPVGAAVAPPGPPASGVAGGGAGAH